jgi:hypothetical protein
MRAVALALVLATATASAAPESDEDETSPTLAVTLSLAGTAAGIAGWYVHPVLGVVGVSAGPAIGRLYNQESGGGVGAIVRLAGTLVVVKLWDEIHPERCESPDPKNECSDVGGSHSTERLAVAVGLGAVALTTLLDILEAGNGAKRRNRRLRIAPTPVGEHLGVSVSLQF